jgi:S1-C subfamily serine protease
LSWIKSGKARIDGKRGDKMEAQTIRRILTVGGLIVAAIVLVVYLTSRYEFTLRERTPTRQEASVSSQNQTVAKGARGEARSTATVLPAVPQVRELSTEELFQAAGPSVVLVEVFDDIGQRKGLGSGFIASEDGAIVTNYHVVRGAQRATVHFADGAKAPVKGILGYDAGRDVAVLRATGVAPGALTLGNSDELRAGQKIVAIGSPLGFQNTVSEGIVSGVRLGVIQMSAPISPGSSGGPVFNTRGEVVGVAVASAVRGQNLNFAVPVNWAKAYLRGNVERPLVEIARENTVAELILDGEISIPAGQTRSWEIPVNPEAMSDPDIRGKIQSVGGLTGNIRILLLHGERILHDSGRVQQDEFTIPLEAEGVYTLVIDNRDSLMFARTVRGRIEFSYVK